MISGFMAAMLKIIIGIIKVILPLSLILIVILGIIGGGWGAKQIPANHPFYQGELQLISHRGVIDQAPENTMAAAARASDLGFLALEFDLKQSSDSQFYLFHDRNSVRLFGEEFPIKQLTLQEIQQKPLLHNEQPSNHRVPDLHSFTSEFANRLNFYVDVKRHGNNRYQRLTTRIASYLSRNGLTDHAWVGSDFLFTTYLEYRYPEIHTVFTGPGDWTIFIYRWIPKKFRPDFIISYANEVTSGHMEWLKRKNLLHRRMVYGVNGENYLQVKTLGIPILVVDYDPVMDQDLSPDRE